MSSPSRPILASSIPKVGELRDQLGVADDSQRAYVFNQRLSFFRKTYVSSSGAVGTDLHDWKSPAVQEELDLMVKAFLEERGFGTHVWPDHSHEGNDRSVLQYSKNARQIKRLVKQLIFRLNQQQYRNKKYKKRDESSKVGRSASTPIEIGEDLEDLNLPGLFAEEQTDNPNDREKQIATLQNIVGRRQEIRHDAIPQLSGLLQSARTAPEGRPKIPTRGSVEGSPKSPATAASPANTTTGKRPRAEDPTTPNKRKKPAAPGGKGSPGSGERRTSDRISKQPTRPNYAHVPFDEVFMSIDNHDKHNDKHGTETTTVPTSTTVASKPAHSRPQGQRPPAEEPGSDSELSDLDDLMLSRIPQKPIQNSSAAVSNPTKAAFPTSIKISTGSGLSHPLASAAVISR